MIKINEDKIIADGLEKDVDKIVVISWSKDYLSFSSRIADCVKYEKGIESFYEELKNAGLKGFVLVNNNIVTSFVKMEEKKQFHLEHLKKRSNAITKST